MSGQPPPDIVDDREALLAALEANNRQLQTFAADLRHAFDSMKRLASEIAELYKRRWQIELFFKWIKQNLELKRFMAKKTRKPCACRSSPP